MRAVSAIYWLFVALSSVALFPIALLLFAVTAPFDPRRVALHRFTCAWASLYTWLNPLWSVAVQGRDHLDDRAPAVLVSNHLSLVDILVLFRLFRHFKWVSKRENFRIPFIGWNMALNGYIGLVRGDRRSVEQMFHRCEQTLRGGSSVLIFPEGTRSKDGVMRPFKSGAFELAARTHVPIVPIALVGSDHALPKKGFTIRRARILVSVLKPLNPETFAGVDPEVLADQVRALLLAEVEALRCIPEP